MFSLHAFAPANCVKYIDESPRGYGFPSKREGRPVGSAFSLLDTWNPRFIMTAFVARLFRVCGPAAILHVIPFIVVNAVYRCAFRSLAHIVVKALKVFPSGTDLNPSTTIIMELYRARASTSLFHSSPALMRWRICHPVRATETAAACGVSRNKASAKDRAGLATQAQAVPQRMRFNFARIRDNSKATKRLSFEVFKEFVGWLFSYNSRYRHICSPEQYVLVG